MYPVSHDVQSENKGPVQAAVLELQDTSQDKQQSISVLSKGSLQPSVASYVPAGQET